MDVRFIDDRKLIRYLNERRNLSPMNIGNFRKMFIGQCSIVIVGELGIGIALLNCATFAQRVGH
jgi:hypothetical protein